MGFGYAMSIRLCSCAIVSTIHSINAAVLRQKSAKNGLTTASKRDCTLQGAALKAPVKPGDSDSIKQQEPYVKYLIF